MNNLRSLLTLASAAFFLCAEVFADGSNAIDRIDFGNPTSEAAHNLDPGTAKIPVAGVGALGQTYRTPLYTEADNRLTFTITVDPVKQNYVTVRMWGSERSGAGLNFVGSNAQDSSLDQGSGVPIFPNRFYYATEPIPLAMTQGKTSIPFTLLEYGVGRPIYSAYIHTEPGFIPDSADPAGSAIPLTGELPLTTPLSKARVISLLQTKRQEIYGPGKYYDTMLARQVMPGTAGAPPEVIGADLGYPVANAANLTDDGWRDTCGSAKRGPGYSTIADEMMSVLVGTYLLPPFTDANDNVVAGLDHYRDPAIIQRLVLLLDSTSYMQASDGHYQNLPESVWQGVTSTNRAAGHLYAGSKTRGPGWSLTLEGVDVECLGRTICQLLDDPVAAPVFQNYLAQNIDGDLSGGSMLRARVYERMLNNSMSYFRDIFGIGTVSQGLFGTNGLYAARVALTKLEALFPYGTANSTFPASTYNYSYPGLTTAQGTDYLLQITGADPATPIMNGLYSPDFTTYAISPGGFGEAHGARSGGYDGRYGTILPWNANMILAAAQHDPNVTPAMLAKVQTQAKRAAEGYLRFISPNEAYAGNANTFSLVQEDTITYRNPYYPNVNAGGLTVGVGYRAADPALGINSPLERRGAYLEAIYNVQPGLGKGGNNQLQWLAELSSYEAVLRGLIDVDPATLTKLPGEPGAGNSAFIDAYTGATAIYYNGERLYLNNGIRNFEYNNNSYKSSYRSRFHQTTSTTERYGTVMMPFDSATQQSDGNLCDTFAKSWVTRLDRWLIAGNPTATARTINLPAGPGQALDLVSGVTYPMGSSVNLPAGGTLALHLALASAARPIADGTYTLANLASNLVLSCPGGAATPGLQIVQATPTADASAQWVFNFANGFYTVKNAASGLYLTGSSASGAALVQQPASGAASQNWQLLQNGAGYVLVSQAGGNLDLNNPGPSQTPGTGMVLSPQDAGPGAVWLFKNTASTQIYPNGAYTITSFTNNLLLDNPGSSTSSGQAMVQQNPNGGTNQQWIFTADGNGFYTIKNAASGLYLTPADKGAAFYYPKLLQKSADGSDWQRWAVFPSLRGTIFISKATGNPIDATGGSTPGQGVQMYDLWIGSQTFIWKLEAAGQPRPAAPTDLAATATAAAASLRWTASPGAIGYNVKRSTGSGGPYTTIASGVSGVTYADSGLTNGTTYYYVVSALSSGGESVNSAEASATPQPTPAAPTGLTATAGNAQVALSWTASATATSYNLKRSLTSGGPYTTIASGLTSPAYTDISASNGSTYFYVVSAVNAAGESSNSAEASALASSSAALPSPWVKTDVGVVGTAGTSNYLGGATFKLSGAGSDIGGTADSFQFAYVTTTSSSYSVVARLLPPLTGSTKAGLLIRRDTTAGARTAGVIVEPNGTSYQARFASRSATSGTMSYSTAMTGLALPQWLKVTRASGTYTGFVSTDGITWMQIGTANLTIPATASTTTYTGLAVTSRNTSALATVTFDNVSLPNWTAPPVAPTLAAAGASPSQINLTWNAVSGATSYQLLRSATPSGTFTQIATPNGTSYADGGLPTNTSYSYLIRATGSSGTSGNSVIATSSTLVNPPSNLTATGANSSAILSWTAVSGASSYNVKRSLTSGSGYSTVASGLTTANFTDSSLTNGTTYYYVVNAVNAGGPSANSTQASATPVAARLAPAGLTATGGNGVVNLSWSAVAGADSYNVKRSPNGINGFATIASTTAANYADTSVSNETTYYYAVTAVNAQGESENSSVSSATPHGSGVWFGNGTDNNWLTTGNWSVLPAPGDQLRFSGATRLASNNNFAANTLFNGIVFSNTAGAFVLSGNAINLGGDIVNNSTNLQTINLGLVLTNPTTTINAAAGPIAIGGVISEGGQGYGIVKAGPQTLTLSGQNSFTGNIAITGGTLIAPTTAPGNATTGSLGNAQVAGRSLSVASGATLTFSTNDVWGNGNANSALLPTIILNGGTLTTTRYNRIGALQLNSGATLTNTSSDAGGYQAWELQGAITVGGTSGSTITSASSSANQYGCHLNNPTTFNVAATGAPGADLTVSAALRDRSGNYGYGAGSLTKTGAGVMLLSSGDNTYTGGTTISGGTLLLTNTTGNALGTGAVMIQASGALGGTGMTSSSVTVQSGGALAPGITGAAGTLRLAALTLSSGSVLKADLVTPTNSDTVTLSGTYTASGTTRIDLTALGGFAGAGTYPLLTGASGISATNFTLGSKPAGYNFTLSVSGNTLNLVAIAYTAQESWRQQYFGTTANSGNAADSADPDSDGMTNANEFAAGTSPIDAASVFKIANIERGTNGWLISFPTVAGKTYLLERSTNLQVNSWSTVQDNIAGTGGVVQIGDPASNAAPQTFYRARIAP